MKISGVVIAFNEEAKIEACLRSLCEVCDEIIVLDSGSSDGTVAIAQDLGAKIFTQAFQGHIEQKMRPFNLPKTNGSFPWTPMKSCRLNLSKPFFESRLPIHKLHFVSKDLTIIAGSGFGMVHGIPTVKSGYGTNNTEHGGRILMIR